MPKQWGHEPGPPSPGLRGEAAAASLLRARLQRWVPKVMCKGSRGTPQTAMHGTQPGAPGRAWGGLVACPPAEAGWRGWARRLAYLHGGTRSGGVGILLRAIGGGLTLELGGQREQSYPATAPAAPREQPWDD
ncbi:hypothetical protein NDU88_002893 [Pleurodeles waltl]|uniref:Uncharacterized protein n=1 Tax=Pleurodeles waltl TaxID=8319 RepID=A0AAV7RGZ8_PLEWA|nr:hypothetical protein NDU88_002893 [Pleurodeles waltl]